MSAFESKQPLQTATKNEYVLVISYWIRLNAYSESQDIISFICKWPEASKICTIQNLWGGHTEGRYGTYMGNYSFTKNKAAVISPEKQHWKQIPIPNHDSNIFYFQHLKSQKYLCFALNGSDNCDLYDETEIIQNNAQRIKCAIFPINKLDEQYVYDTSKIPSTFYIRDEETSNHMAFRGVTVAFYDRYNINDLTPWLIDYIEDTTIETIRDKRIKFIQSWLEKLGVEEYLNHFIGNGYDRMEVILEMDETELRQIGIFKMGHRVLLIDCIKRMRQNAIKEYVESLDMNAF